MSKRTKQTPVISDELVVTKIYTVRGYKVMLDRDLAELYGVPTKALKQAVRRNADRFPEDFMFEMSGSPPTFPFDIPAVRFTKRS